MDTSGAGDSGHREQYTAALFAEEISQVSSLLSADQVYVVGHSFGGTMSRIASWLHPDDFAGLILVDSALVSRKGRRQPPPRPPGERRVGGRVAHRCAVQVVKVR